MSTGATHKAESSSAAPLSTSTTASGVHSTSTSPASTQTGFSGFKVPHILSWRNPYETGTLLAEVLGLFIVLSSSFTLRIFVKFASSLIGLVSLAELGSRAISGQRSGLVSTYQPSRFLPFSDTFVHNVAAYVSNVFSRAIFGIQHLIDARAPKKGLKLSVLLYTAYVLLGFFSLKTLVLTSIIVAFSLPPLYLQFKPEIDRAIGDVHKTIHRQAKVAGDKIYAKAGPQIDYVKKLVGPRGGFPGHANVSPVGEVPTAAATKPASFSTTVTPSSHSHSTAAPTTAGLSAGVAPLSEHKAPISEHPATTTTAAVPNDVFQHFDTVPTLAGNLPIDHQKLAAALAADRAKAEGSVNGL